LGLYGEAGLIHLSTENMPANNLAFILQKLKICFSPYIPLFIKCRILLCLRVDTFANQALQEW
jgi:hypothetical protein